MIIVFLDINPSFERAFAASRELGLQTTYITTSPQRLEQARALCDHAVLVSDYELDTLNGALAELQARQPITAVWTLKDQLVPAASALSRQFAPASRVYSANLADVCKNKYSMRCALQGTAYNPEFELYARGSSGTRPFTGRTIVIKPLLGYSSIGVEKISPEDDFRAGLDRTFSVLEEVGNSVKGLESGTGPIPSDFVLIEDCIEDIEVSAEVFANDDGIRCLGVCGKSEMIPPFFEEVSYSMPAPLRSEDMLRVSEAAVDVMKRLGLTSGMAHLEFRVTDEKIKVLDIGLRLGGGGLTHDLVYQSSGIDMVKAVLAEMCGMPSGPYLQCNWSDIAFLYLLQIRGGGRVAALPDFNDLSDHEVRLATKCFYNSIGDKLTGYPAYSGLPGFALFRISGSGEMCYQKTRELLAWANEKWAIRYE